MRQHENPNLNNNHPGVQARNIRKSFGDREVLRGIDIDISSGEVVALLGKSGTGKSTLLRALAGLDNDVEGELVLPESTAVVFQQPRLLPWARAIDNVTIGMPAKDRRLGIEALGEVGLEEFIDAWPVNLSGGQAQRVALARALVREPGLLLLDEPFGALDALTRLQMQSLLRSLIDKHSPAVLLVTHDVDEALILADRILVLDAGVITFTVGSADSPVSGVSGERHQRYRTELLTALGVSVDAVTQH